MNYKTKRMLKKCLKDDIYYFDDSKLKGTFKREQSS